MPASFDVPSGRGGPQPTPLLHSPPVIHRLVIRPFHGGFETAMLVDPDPLAADDAVAAHAVRHWVDPPPERMSR
jgi:hypothetical protein